MNFKQAHPLLIVFWNICLLRQGPQVLPASLFLLMLLVILNALISSVSFLLEYALLQAVLRTLTDVAVSLGLAYLILFAAKKTARILQSLIALSGTSIILNIVSLPLLWFIPELGDVSDLVLTLLTIILFWNMLIIGHIFRHALSISLPFGILVSMSYVVMALAIFYSIFPAPIH